MALKEGPKARDGGVGQPPDLVIDVVDDEGRSRSEHAERLRCHERRVWQVLEEETGIRRVVLIGGQRHVFNRAMDERDAVEPVREVAARVIDQRRIDVHGRDVSGREPVKE